MAEAACLTLEPAAKNSVMSLLVKRMKMVVSNSAAQPDSSLPNVAYISKEVQPKEETIQVTDNKTDGDKGADENCSVGDTEEKKAQNGAEKMMEEATVYHSYQVRRSEPLEKLKEIAEVSKELTNVKTSIQAFEHSSDLQNDEKQRIALGENIMRLLLKLEIIQICVIDASPLDPALNVAADGGTEILKREPDHEEEEVEPIIELPIGLLDEEETVESKSVNDKDMERMMELPVGFLDEEGTIESELVKHVAAERVPPTVEEECSVAAKDTQPEPKQQMEEQEEVQSSEESSGWVKVEISKEEELESRTH
ncbi:hypothetical protein HN51_021049 [Arachis hypogaea]